MLESSRAGRQHLQAFSAPLAVERPFVCVSYVHSLASSGGEGRPAKFQSEASSGRAETVLRAGEAASTNIVGISSGSGRDQRCQLGIAFDKTGGEFGKTPSKSSVTRIWPSQAGEAPIPI